MLPYRHFPTYPLFRGDISNGSRVIVLTDRHTNTQTDTTGNNTICVARVVIIPDIQTVGSGFGLNS